MLPEVQRVESSISYPSIYFACMSQALIGRARALFVFTQLTQAPPHPLLFFAFSLSLPLFL